MSNRKFIKTFSLLFYFLVLLVFCILGMMLAAWTGAGKGQGLAGGPIILSYGLGSAFAAWLLSLWVVYMASMEKIKLLNKILVLILMALIGYLVLKSG